MRDVKHPPRGLVLALLVLLVVAFVALPAACDCRDVGEHDAFLCFTPASASLAVGNSLQVSATLQPEDLSKDKGCIEKSGWRWAWGSDDGGEIEFGDDDLQWIAGEDDIYVAQVYITATKAGTVSLKLEQPSCGYALDFMGTFSCINSCTITVTTGLMW
jgi:hypothetical protein